MCVVSVAFCASVRVSFWVLYICISVFCLFRNFQLSFLSSGPGSSRQGFRFLSFSTSNQHSSS